MQSPWASELGAPWMSLVWVMWASCYNWFLIAIDLFVHWVNPQVSWLCESSLTTVHVLLCRCWPQKVELASADFGAWQDIPLDLMLMQLTGSCSDVVWTWQQSLFVLGPLERTLLQANLRRCLDNSCQESHSLWLPLLGIGSRLTYTSNELKAGQQRPKIYLSLPLCLAAAC